MMMTMSARAVLGGDQNGFICEHSLAKPDFVVPK